MSEAAKPTPEAVRELAAKLVPVLLRYGVVRAGVFGSVARGEAGPESDLDLLVEYRQEPRMTLRDLVDLYEELSHLAGRRVAIGREGSGTYLTARLLFKLGNQFFTDSKNQVLFLGAVFAYRTRIFTAMPRVNNNNKLSFLFLTPGFFPLLPCCLLKVITRDINNKSRRFAVNRT